MRNHTTKEPDQEDRMRKETAVNQEDRQRKVTAIRRMYDARNRLLHRNPFFGTLLMNLQLGLEDCGTAWTDMTHLVFDPDFANRLTPEELIFVMEHEVLKYTLLDNSHAKEKFGWTPKTSFEEGLKNTIDFTVGVLERANK